MKEGKVSLNLFHSLSNFYVSKNTDELNGSCGYRIVLYATYWQVSEATEQKIVATMPAILWVFFSQL